MTSKMSVVDSIIVYVCWQSASELFLLCWHEEPSFSHITMCLPCTHIYVCTYTHSNEELTWKPKSGWKFVRENSFSKFIKSLITTIIYSFGIRCLFCPASLPFSIQVQKLKWRPTDGTKKKKRSHGVYTVRYIHLKSGCYFEVWLVFFFNEKRERE